MKPLLVVAGLTAAGLLLARHYCTVVTVRGHSMNPTLTDGQRVFAVRRPRYRVGDVIVFRVASSASGPGDPAHRIKRVVAAGGAARPAVLDESTLPATVPAGHLAVIGDNTGHSQDSRQLGYIPLSDVIGRARIRFRR
jgi:signal peptidase I